jgi:hypothetical protein
MRLRRSSLSENQDKAYRAIIEALGLRVATAPSARSSRLLAATRSQAIAAGRRAATHVHPAHPLCMGSMSIYAEECSKMIADPETRLVRGSV